jgi:hypothetical protein
MTIDFQLHSPSDTQQQLGVVVDVRAVFSAVTADATAAN